MPPTASLKYNIDAGVVNFSMTGLDGNPYIYLLDIEELEFMHVFRTNDPRKLYKYGLTADKNGFGYYAKLDIREKRYEDNPIVLPTAGLALFVKRRLADIRNQYMESMYYE